MAASSRGRRQRAGRAAVASLIEGIDYQFIYGWFRCLDLLREVRQVISVSIEDPTALAFDDVTIRTSPGASRPPQFVQVKFHVDQAGHYSTEKLMATKTRKGQSLLQKAWDAWHALKDDHPELELVLVTTYSWDPADKVATHLRDRDRFALSREFIEGRVTGQVKSSRDKWKDHLGNPDDADFQAFLSRIRLRLAMSSSADLIERSGEIMFGLRLRHDTDAVLKGARQVHDWIIAGREIVTATEMNDAIERLDLREPGVTAQPSVSLFIHTVLKEPQEPAADFELDWREYFEGDEWERGHAIKDAAAWNGAMLPQLEATRQAILTAASTRFLRLAGKARLSAWFAIGFVFRQSAGWTLEVNQPPSWWRNDPPAAPDVTLITTTEDRGGADDTIAVALSISGDIAPDVRKYLESDNEPAATLLAIQSSLGIGRSVVRGAEDLVSIAEQLRAAITTAQGRRPRRVLLFYGGPAAGAAFIGAALNAVAAEIQIYEDQVGTYAPSFLLKQN